MTSETSLSESFEQEKRIESIVQEVGATSLSSSPEQHHQHQESGNNTIQNCNNDYSKIHMPTSSSTTTTVSTTQQHLDNIINDMNNNVVISDDDDNHDNTNNNKLSHHLPNEQQIPSYHHDDDSNVMNVQQPTITISNNDDAIISKEDNNFQLIDVTRIFQDCCYNSLNVCDPFIYYPDHTTTNTDTTTTTTTVTTKTAVEEENNNNSTTSTTEGRLDDITAPTTTTATTTMVSNNISNFNNQNQDNRQRNHRAKTLHFLQDAMSATQLMDPKMDCCMLPISTYKQNRTIPSTTDDVTKNNNDNNKIDKLQLYVFPRPIPDSLLHYNPYIIGHTLPWNDLTLYDCAIILLELMVRFQSLLSGVSVSESIFTCYYCHTNILYDMKNQLFEENINIDNDSYTLLQQQHETTTTDTTKTTSSLLDDKTHDNDNDNIDIMIETKRNILTKLIIFASSLALVDTTEVIRGVILNADIYEEEDFTTNTHYISFFTDIVDINTTKILELTLITIDELLDLLSTKRKRILQLQHQNEKKQQQLHQKNEINNNNNKCRNVNNNNNNNNNNGISSQQEKKQQQIVDDSDEVEALSIIRHIIEYQLDFLISCSSLARLSPIDIHHNVQSIQLTIRHASLQLNQLLHILNQYQGGGKQQNNKYGNIYPTTTTNTTTTNNDIPIEDKIVNDEDDVHIKSLLLKTFDSYVNRPLVGNLPVRKIRFHKPMNSIELLIMITNELDNVLCNILLHGTSLRRIHRILDRVSRANNYHQSTIATSSLTNNIWNKYDNMNILTRSLLLLNLYFDEKLLGQYTLKDLIIHDILREEPSSLVPQQQQHASSTIQGEQQQFQQRKQNSQQQTHHPPASQQYLQDSLSTSVSSSASSSMFSSELARAFINRLAKPVYDVLKLNLLNRNRHRAFIEAVCIPDWVTLQNEVQLFDTHWKQQQQQKEVEQQQQNQQVNNGSQETNNNNIMSSNQLYQIFTQYTMNVVLRLMDRYIESGIEIGLFQSTSSNNCFDLSCAFWYRTYILSALSHDMIRTTTKRLEEKTKIEQQQQQQHKQQPISPKGTNNNNSSNSHSTSKGNNRKKGNNKSNGSKSKAVKAAAVQSSSTPTTETATTTSNSNQQNDILCHEELEDLLEYKLIVIKRNLCRKIVEYIAALQQSNVLMKIKPTNYNIDTTTMKHNDAIMMGGYYSYEYASLEKIFEKRFELFQNIAQPPMLCFDHYREGTDFTTVSSNDLILIASTGFQSIRNELDLLLQELMTTKPNTTTTPDHYNNIGYYDEKMKVDPMYVAVSEDEIKSLIKVCIGNSVYIQKLKLLLQSESVNMDSTSPSTTNNSSSLKQKIKVVFDFDTHIQFCTIKLL